MGWSLIVVAIACTAYHPKVVVYCSKTVLGKRKEERPNTRVYSSITKDEEIGKAIEY